jgi:hypothetical protein
MARCKKYKLTDFPEDGTVFAVPLENGQIGVCRVIRKKVDGVPCALVAVSDWIGNEPPQLNDSVVRRILIKNFLNWKNDPEIIWVLMPPPKEFRRLGIIEVLPEEKKMDSPWHGGWNFPGKILTQWRWENDRKAVLAEYAEKNALESAKRKEAIQKRAKYLAEISFSELLEKDLFPTWDDYPPEAIKKGCEQIIQLFIRTLDTAKRPLTRNFVTKELKKCIEELNQFDSKNNNFIETVERDDLCEVLEEIVNAAKFPDLIEKVEDWKDW